VNSSKLIYKKFTTSDFVHYRRWYSSDEVMRYIMGRGLTQQECLERFAKAITINGEYPELGFYAVVRKEDNTFIGITKLVYTKPAQAEVGYGALPEFWGKGYATEMLTAAIEHAKTILSLNELLAIVNPANTGSKKVLTNQLFELQGTGMEHDRPVEYYRLKLT
jgi:ribosomal-protein-alanine N-acetyltransferase